MKPNDSKTLDASYWNQRYTTGNTGWDVGAPTLPISAFLDRVSDKNIRLLIPGAGNAYEAMYAWKNGFKNVHVLDIAEIPLQKFSKSNPGFPQEQLILEDFFDHRGQYDLIIEQTFFCALLPSQEVRQAYAKKMHELLANNGQLAGVWFDFPLVVNNFESPPFGGTKSDYLTFLKPYFETVLFERCRNSIPERLGIELFGIFKKK